MIAYWIAYGSAYIGGSGETQSNMAWRLPIIIQGIPAVILAVGVWFLPFSPRLLVNKGRDEEALATLSKLRRLPADDPAVVVEMLEIKSESLIEKRSFEKRFPELSQRRRTTHFLEKSRNATTSSASRTVLSALPLVRW